MSMFSAPSAPSGGIKWEDHKGSLLLVEPLSVETGISTTFGVADAVKATIVVIDGADAGTRFDDCLVFPKLLQSQIRNQVGSKVLGRLGQGVAKAGQSAPWVLAEATTDDVAKAEAWVRANQGAGITSAAAPF